MTPERLNYLKTTPIQMWLAKDRIDLLADLEESQQQLESKDEAIKLLMFNRNSWEEAEKKAQCELVEAQQTIDRLQAAFEDEGSYKPKYRMYAEENLLLIEEGKS